MTRLLWSMCGLVTLTVAAISACSSSSTEDAGGTDAGASSGSSGGSSGSGTSSSGGPADAGAPDGAASDASPFACTVTAAADAGGVIACDGGGVDAGPVDCAFSACLAGGLQESFTASQGCGALGNNSLFWDQFDPQAGASMSVTITFTTNIPVDQIGNVAVDNVGITETFGADGGTSSWKTPPGSCTVTLASSTCAPEFAVQHRRILTGAGSCTQPAAPQAGTAGGAVNVGSFTFTGFFDPP